MSIVYSCFRCKKYKVNMKSYMYKHLCKDTKCHIVSPDVLKYSEDEIIKFSLIPESKLEYLNINKENYTVTKSPIEFMDELKDIYNSKRKNCNHCNKIFERYKELEKHLFECVHINSPKNKNQYNTNITYYIFFKQKKYGLRQRTQEGTVRMPCLPN